MHFLLGELEVRAQMRVSYQSIRRRVRLEFYAVYMAHTPGFSRHNAEAQPERLTERIVLVIYMKHLPTIFLERQLVQVYTRD